MPTLVGQSFKEVKNLADIELTAPVGRSAPSHTAVRLADSPRPGSEKKRMRASNSWCAAIQCGPAPQLGAQHSLERVPPASHRSSMLVPRRSLGALSRCCGLAI